MNSEEDRDLMEPRSLEARYPLGALLVSLLWSLVVWAALVYATLQVVG